MIRKSWPLLFGLLFFLDARAQTPLYTAVLVSDTGTNNNIGGANTSRNVGIDVNGNIYVAFTGSKGIRVAKSTNRGQSCLPSVQVSTENAEPEIEVADNGDVYVIWNSNNSRIRLSRSTDGGVTFSTPVTVGNPGASPFPGTNSVPHMAVKGNRVYVITQNGQTLYYNRNYGVGAFSSTSNVSSYVFADVRIREDSVVFVPTDDPFLRLFKSVDSGASLSQVTLNPGGNVYYSSYTLSGGGLGNFIFTGGGGTTNAVGYKYDLSNGTTTQLPFGTNATNEGRTLFADDYGDLIDGYRDAGGNLLFNISYNQGQTFQSPVTVANGLSHNLGVNHVYEDVVIAYESNGQVYLAIYPDLIKRITITSTIPADMCPGQAFTISFSLLGAYALNNTVTAQLSNANGSFAAPVNIGSTAISSGSGTINVTIPAGATFGTGYRIRLVSSNPIVYSKNNGFNITIGAPTPSVVLTHVPADSVCSGQPVTFTAVPTNGGAAPLYQFRKNGINVGASTTNNVYVDASLTSSDQISVVMSTGHNCQPNMATSPNSSILVRPTVTPSVTLAAVPAGSICAGTMVMFTATPVNGGTGPLYQFQKNGVNVGANSATPTYTDTSLTSSDVITVVMTPNNTCQTSSAVTSNSIQLVVYPNVTPAVSITANPGDSICRGASVTFTAATVNGGSGAYPAFQWRKNGAAIAGATAITYTDAGLVTNDVISVHMTSNMICRTTDTATSNKITMWVATAAAVPPRPGPVSGATKVCAGSTQSYNIAAVPSATYYTWTLPPGWSGNTPTAGINAVVGSTVGTGTIMVTANNDCGASLPRTLNDTVITIPAQPGPISGSTSACANSAQTYTIAAVPEAIYYTWSVPAGWGPPANTTTTLNTTAANVFGSGNISVTATNACGTSIPRVLPVTAVTQPPAQPGPIIGSTNVCGGTMQPYRVDSIYQATSYVWTLPQNGWTAAGATGNTATTPGPNLSAMAGQNGGTLQLIAANGCGTSPSRSVNITVTNIPGQPGIVSGPDSICAGAGGTWSIGYVNEATSYVWTIPSSGGWTGASTTQVLNATSGASTPAGTGTITVAGTNFCGTGPAVSKPVWITLPVTPTVSLSATDTTACSGTPVIFTATATNGGAQPTYQWQVNSQNTGSPTTNPVFNTTGLASGSNRVSVILKSMATCATPQYVTSNAIAMQITQTETPGVNINANQPASTICAGVPVTFTATPLAGAGSTPSFQWYKNNNPIGTNSRTYMDTALVSGDSIGVVMTSSSACVTSTTAQSNKIGVVVSPVWNAAVTITASPGVAVSAGTTITFNAQATNGGANPSWQWLKNGQGIAGATGSTYTTNNLRSGDVISVRLMPDLVCAGSQQVQSNALTVQVSTGIGGNGTPDDDYLILYPNPNQGGFTVKVKSGAIGKQMKLDVLGMLGQIVSHTVVTPDRPDWSAAIQLGAVAAGNYLLRLSNASDGRVMAVKRFEVVR